MKYLKYAEQVRRATNASALSPNIDNLLLALIVTKESIVAYAIICNCTFSNGSEFVLTMGNNKIPIGGFIDLSLK